jgi:hypothetical protein
MRNDRIGSGVATAAAIWLGACSLPLDLRDSGDSPAKIEPAAATAPPVTPVRVPVAPPAAAPAATPVSAPIPSGRPPNWVARTPPTNGRAGNGSLQFIGGAIEGSIERLNGAAVVNRISHTVYTGGADTVLDLAVEAGRVRAYLQYFPDTGFIRRHDGYLFAEAQPGQPARIAGFLESDGGGEHQSYAIVFESLDGEARGVRYTVTPR